MLSRSSAALAVVLACAGSAQAFTVATFADPTTGPVPSLFQWNATTNTLTGGYFGSNLTLETPGIAAPDFPGATFSMAPLVGMNIGGGVVQFGPGSIQFFDSGNQLIFNIAFSSAIMNMSLSFGASDFIGFNVDFTGSMMDMETEGEAFAFSFANPTATQNGFDVTASFTSSADRFIPTPGGALLAGIGGLYVLRRKRR